MVITLDCDPNNMSSILIIHPNCEFCHKEFFVFSSKRFCNKICKNSFIGQKIKKSIELKTQCKIDEYNKNKKYCAYCKIELSFKQRKLKFCSKQCAYNVVSFSVKRSIDRFCSKCNIQIFERKKYCKKCRDEALLFENVSLKVKKRILIKENGNFCQCCGLSHWLEDVISLQIDHIDGNPDNNLKSNLRLLCANCHFITPTFGAKNIGKFPSSKRKMKKVLSPSF